ncbi:hypothetical protein [Pedobacter sp. BAL39]|uniref:hypothetical protein n=1 Tax=Pedobacter sp. BAL39 TaxID=391596 RepID=UPI0002E62BA3|nr:hypothetical protein [Pedobacter sp. BAL39]
MNLLLTSMLALALGSQLPASAASTDTTIPGNFDQSSLSDTTKKAMSAKDWKKMEKEIKKSMPKDMAKIMIKQLKSVDPNKMGDFKVKSGNAALTNYDLSSSDMEEAFDKSEYREERKDIIDDFKSESFDSGSERREARKEMKQELRELRKEFKREQKDTKKESKQDQREMKRDLKEAMRDMKG